ncbi:hypothetical protein J2S00_003409 [Caldalkalibacillus uzonensis]|uniref:Uncharacterized protein n=1 Tax=Caldalkalibacillus uzonensis TaxID=353224 RepID=A0ABU0CVY4_9BACI|nr:hypothetical protein [Caldalkalibacillus uzonensis]MDQ0340585.1 hypothetical protein [Caldalkalibacillus uzonensis]
MNYEQNYIVETSNNQFDFEFAVESKDGIKLKLINAPKSNTSSLVNRTLRIWVEIEKDRGTEYPKNHRFTLLDDSFYTWKPGDYQVLEHFSYELFAKSVRTNETRDERHGKINFTP